MLATNVRSLLQPAKYQEQMMELLETVRFDAQLPRLREVIGRSTVDVFGQQQAYAIFNDLNYRPRPLFQSYMAYNRRLMRLNEEFYASKAAPEYVLFDLSPMDRKFPPLEDAMVLRHLVTNYKFVDAEGPFLLLKSAPSATPRLTLLREGLVHAGERINLQDLGEVNMCMEIQVEPTLLGRARQLFYKPSPVQLSVWKEATNAKPVRFRAPVPMMAAGFLASPLLSRREDVLDLYRGTLITHPAGYSVEISPDTLGFWQAAIKFRIYQIENPLGRFPSPDSTRRIPPSLPAQGP
jgi:hypothetical protein